MATIDIDRLRAALIEETGPAAFVGSPWALADVVALESADPMELIREAERRGWDLRRFDVSGWTGSAGDV
ncbi:MAG TPA: hypothetical protein K8U80_10785 [Collinsella ihuae]|uniref:Uncharacterized protein n=1 Tax=Collinsella ihumii TaxID=1720204 RepID=A0A921IRM4_9ACTN|nr:hypothetical protein [Collinsella ihumii]